MAHSTLFSIGGQESSAWDTGWEMFTLLTNRGGDLLVLKSVAARLHHRLLVQARVNAQRLPSMDVLGWRGDLGKASLSQGATGTWPISTLVV